MTDYYADLFNRLNRETREDSARKVDRYNPSARSCYSYFDPYRQNNETHKQNNGQFSNYYGNRSR